MPRRKGEKYYELTDKQVAFIRKRMKDKGITIKSVAEKAGVGESTFSQAFSRAEIYGHTVISGFVYKPLIQKFQGMGKCEQV